MKETEVTFKDKQDRNIAGTLLIPDGSGPFPAVIVCHGFKSLRKQTHIRAIAEEISAKELATLRFDFTKDPGESSLPFPEMTVTYELEVLDEAVKFLKAQVEINPEKIGMTGHSLGGLVVGWYSANNPNIAAVVPLSGVYSFEEAWRKAYGEETMQEFKEKGFAQVFSQTLNRPLRINESYYQDALGYDMDKVIENLVCPILVVHGTADQSVPLEHAQHFYDRARSQVKELKIIKGSDHNYTKPEHLDEVKTAVAGWFAKVLLAKAN